MTTVSLPYSSYKRGKSTCAELVKFVNLHSTVGSLQFCVQSGNMYMLMRIPVFLADQAGLKPVKQPILVERAVYGCKKGEGFTVLKIKGCLLFNSTLVKIILLLSFDSVSKA